jgi:hypothetical protein
MQKAGASRNDKKMIRNYMSKGVSLNNISRLTSVRIEHVTAIAKQIREGTLKIGGKLDYQHGDIDGNMLDGLTSPQQSTRMDEIAAENAALKARLDALEGVVQTPQADFELQVEDTPADPDLVIPEGLNDVVAGEADDDPDPELAATFDDEAEEVAATKEKNQPRRRKRAA